MAGRAPYWLLIDWQGGVAGPSKMCRVDLDLTGGSGEAAWLAGGRIDLGILLVAGLASAPHAHRVLTQLLHGQSRGRQFIAVCGLDVAIEKVFAQAQPCSQVKDDRHIRP